MTTTTTRRRRLLFLVFAVALSLPLTAFAQEGGEGPKTPPSPEVAAPIYEDRCANCHGLAGQGDGPQAVQANLPVPDLTDLALLRATTPVRWFDIISNGVAGAAMPPFGDGSSEPIRSIDRWNLVFHLYTLGTPPAQVEMGKAIYKGRCVECHGDDGTGTIEDAPDFTDLVAMATRSQADLFAAIEKHDLGLGDVEIWALTDYVRTFDYNYAPPTVVGAPSDADTPVVSSPFTGGAGVISGQVTNATPGSAPPEGEVIQLRAFGMDASFIDAITTTVMADGSFRFEGIDPAVPVQFEPLIVYQDVPYFGDLDTAITLSSEQPEVNVTVTVYETTDDASDIRIERLHLVFDVAPDRVQVAELYILSNDGTQAYVGTLEEGTLPLTIPPNALSFQPGGDPSRYLTLADGIADTIPVLPGQSTAESVIVYELAYDGELDLSRPLPYDASKINVFLPSEAGIEVSGDQVRSGGPFQAQSTILDTYLADDLSAGDRLTLRLSGEPQVSREAAVPSPHQESGPSQSQSIIIGAIVLVSAVALAYLYWQGHLSLGFKPAAADRQSDLLQAIADLDDDYEAGRVKENRYRAKRAQLKEELIELMEREQ